MSEHIKKQLQTLPPMTPQETAERMSWIEDIAATERSMGGAARHILENLLMELHRLKVLDAAVFLEGIQGGIQKIDDVMIRQSALLLTKALLSHISLECAEEKDHTCKPTMQ